MNPPTPYFLYQSHAEPVLVPAAVAAPTDMKWYVRPPDPVYLTEETEDFEELFQPPFPYPERPAASLLPFWYQRQPDPVVLPDQVEGMTAFPLAESIPAAVTTIGWFRQQPEPIHPPFLVEGGTFEAPFPYPVRPAASLLPTWYERGPDPIHGTPEGFFSFVTELSLPPEPPLDIGWYRQPPDPVYALEDIEEEEWFYPPFPHPDRPAASLLPFWYVRPPDPPPPPDWVEGLYVRDTVPIPPPVVTPLVWFIMPEVPVHPVVNTAEGQSVINPLPRPPVVPDIGWLIQHHNPVIEFPPPITYITPLPFEVEPQIMHPTASSGICKSWIACAWMEVQEVNCAWVEDQFISRVRVSKSYGNTPGCEP